MSKDFFPRTMFVADWDGNVVAVEVKYYHDQLGNETPTAAYVRSDRPRDIEIGPTERLFLDEEAAYLYAAREMSAKAADYQGRAARAMEQLRQVRERKADPQVDTK